MERDLDFLSDAMLDTLLSLALRIAKRRGYDCDWYLIGGQPTPWAILMLVREYRERNMRTKR